MNGYRNMRSVWRRRNTHQAGVCILHILQQNGEYTHECIFPSALVFMPPEGGGKRQLFTLTVTPAVNSVHLACVFGLEVEADVETGRIH